MKRKRILKITLGTLAALLVLLVLTVLFWLGPTVKFLAKTIGPKALGTDLQVKKLKINPIKGTIQLSDFSIKNPDIFGQSNAVSLASLDISVDMASLFSSTIIVHQVEINSPYFIYEQDLQSDNITEFIRNVQAFAQIDPEAPPKPQKKEKKKDTDKSPPVVIVEQLAINDVQFNLANTHDELLDIGAGFESLTISMTNGTFFLDNVYVRNPKRLETPNLFTLDGVHVEMEPESILSTNIHFKSVKILNPHVFIEHNPETDTVGEFLKIASSLTAKIPTNAPSRESTSAVAETAAGPEENQPPPPEITLDLFVINDVQLHAVNIGDPALDVFLGMDRFSAALEEGDIRLEGLHLSNPAQFTLPNLFALDQLSVQLQPGSLKEEPVVIEDIRIIQPHAFLELHTNYNTVSEFLRIANGYIERIPTYQIPKLPPAPENAATPKTAAQADAPAAPPVELCNLQVDDIQLQLLDHTVTNNPFPQPAMVAGIKEIFIRLSEGKLSISDILVPSPDGFRASSIFQLAQIAVGIDPDTIYSDQVVINDIFIDTPRVNLEQTETSGNVASLQTTLLKFTPAPDQLPQLPEKPQQAAAEPAEAETEPIPLADQPVVLHQLLVTNLMVHLTLPASNSNGTEEGVIGRLNPFAREGKGEESEEPQVIEAAVPAVPVSNEPMTLVAFDHLSLEPLKGLLYIKNLQVSNPPNFTPKNLVQLEEFRLDIDPDTIRTDTLHIEDVLVQKPRIRYERQIRSDNIKALQTEIENATMRRDEFTQTEPAEDEKKDTEDQQKVVIDRVLIQGGMVQAKLSIAPSIPVPLPTIELNDIGKEKGGASVEEAGTQVFNATYDAVIGAVGNATGFAGDSLKGIGSLTFDTLGNAVNTVSGGVSKVTKETAEAVKETTKKTRSKFSKGRRAGGKSSAAH